MTRSAARVGEAGLELGRMLATFVWVTAAAAAALAVLGAVPARLAGDTRGVRHVRSIDDAERILGRRLAVPAYFPERLEWPPAAIRVAGGRHGSACLAIRERAAGTPAVEIVQSTEPGEAIAAALLEDRTVLRSSRTVVGARPATLADILHEGAAWRELSWKVDGREVVLRTRGELDEAYRMARTLRREGPR